MFGPHATCKSMHCFWCFLSVLVNSLHFGKCSKCTHFFPCFTAAEAEATALDFRGLDNALEVMARGILQITLSKKSSKNSTSKNVTVRESDLRILFFCFCEDRKSLKYDEEDLLQSEDQWQYRRFA